MNREGQFPVTVIPVPKVPARVRHQTATEPVTFTPGHHFSLDSHADVAKLSDTASAPLSVIVQVTKRCDFNCGFCSETLQMPDPTLTQLDTIRANLGGVQRVFLSGGEPLLRRDLPDIIDMYSGFILGLPTNATRGLIQAPHLTGKVAFVNVGFDGPRATFSRVRGDYDKVMTGVRAFQDAGLPISLSAVVLRSTVHALPYLYQIADVLDAGKLKLILPLRKGNALGLPEREFITVAEATEAFTLWGSMDPLVAPGVVLGGEPGDERGELRADRRPSGLVRVGPFAGDEAAVPAQDGAGGDEPVRSQPGRQEPDQRGEDRPVGPVELRPGIGAAEDGDFVSQHEQFGVFGCR